MKARKNGVWKALTMVTQVSISMLSPIFLGCALGWWLDHHFGTQYWFLIFLVLGVGAAFRNVYMLTRSFYYKDMQKEHARMKYLEDLKNYSREHPQEAIPDPLERKSRRYPDHK